MKGFFKSVFATITGIVIVMVLFIFVMIGFVASMATLGEKEVTVKDNSILELNLSGEIVERKLENPFDEIMSMGNDVSLKIGLNQILESLEKAAGDSKISGVFVESSMFSTGLATATEIRNALIKFKKSGKFIVAYSGYYTQGGYYIASVADVIALNPMGSVDLKGFSSEQIFFKNMFEKIGVEVTVVKHGKYKSAIEPLINDKMSDENREQMSALLNGFWNVVRDTIASSRGILASDIDKVANNIQVFSKAEENVSLNLVDTLLYLDQVYDLMKRKMKIPVKDGLPYVKLDDYAKVANPNNKYSKDKIAYIYAVGGIDDGSSEGINSKSLAETIRKARKDSTVKAIVFRVNSPGGSAYGSEQIWREVSLAKAAKPVVVSMGDYAASGGYYIACVADSIVAQPTTLTGSIGIFGAMFNVEGMTKKVGISWDRVKTHQYSDLLSGTRKMMPEENRILQNYIDRGYETFVTRCADGRKTTYANIDNIGQGRVWTGVDALNNKLVDKFGGINDAIEMAARMAKLKNYRIQYLPEEKSFYDKIIEELTGQVKSSIFRTWFGVDLETMKQIEQLKSQQVLQARMPFDLKIY